MHMLKPVCDDNMKGLGSPEDVQEKPHEARDKYGAVKKTGLANHFGFQAKTQSGGGTKSNREEVQVEPLMISSKYPRATTMLLICRIN